MNWYVGQKVVCVDDSKWEGRLPPLVKKGSTYTIRFILECPNCAACGIDVGFASRSTSASCLCGAIGNTYGHQVHDSSRFRPLDSLTEQMERIESEGAPVEQPEPQHA